MLNTEGSFRWKEQGGIARLDYKNLTENTSPHVVCLQGQLFPGLLESVGVVFLSKSRLPSTHPGARSIWRESQKFGFSPARGLWEPHRVARKELTSLR